MLYILGSKNNSYDLISFDHDSSSDHLLFKEGQSLKGEGVILNYQIESKADLEKLKKIPYIESSGPSLVTAALKEVFEEDEARGQVEFYPVNVFFQGEVVEGFYAINPLKKIDCTNMTASEYSIINFDPGAPEYSFDYQVLKADFDENLNVATCDEMPREIIINDSIVDKIRSAKIKGFLLYSALDMTMENRSVCVKI